GDDGEVVQQRPHQRGGTGTTAAAAFVERPAAGEVGEAEVEQQDPDDVVALVTVDDVALDQAGPGDEHQRCDEPGLPPQGEDHDESQQGQVQQRQRPRRPSYV